MSDFSLFDLVVGVLILFLAIRGAVNGFAREFFGFVGIVGGVYGASVYGEDVGQWISANLYAFQNPSAITLIGFLVLLALIWGTALIIAEIAQKLVHLSSLGGLNSFLGFCFGALKVFMIFAILVVTLTHIQFAKNFLEGLTQGSYLYPVLRDVGAAVIKLDVAQNSVPNQDALQNNAPSLDDSQNNIF